jgi:tetratricopeptide (TPR) repeat protein
MRKISILFASAFICRVSSAISFLGFGTSDSGRPPKIHELLRPANELIEQADDASYSGDVDKAVDLYKKAVDLLEKIKAENPERAETSEFQPLRNKLAVCNTSIDSLLLYQLNAQETRFAVSDTTELRKKYNEKHNIKTPEPDKKQTKQSGDEKDKKSANDSSKEKKEAADSKSGAGKKESAEAAAKKPAPAARPAGNASGKLTKDRIGVMLESTKDFIAEGNWSKASKSLTAILKSDPENWEARSLLVFVNLAVKDIEAADIITVDMINDRPDDVPTLLLYAAVRSAKRDWTVAKDALKKALRLNPDYYATYYNMAHLLIESGADKKTAARFYKAGRGKGGPRDVSLERQLGGFLK